MHKSVLLKEVVDYLSPQSSNIYVDATLGAGGHAEKILEESSPKGRLIGIDIDSSMLKVADRRLRKFGKRCILVEDNYIHIAEILSELKIREVSGIVFDLGIASEHFDVPKRGFSLRRSGPLDMRLNPKAEISAEYIINEWEEEELRGILYKFGEERYAKKIVEKIILERKKNRITNTAQLAEIVERAVFKFRHKKNIYKNKVPGYRVHPATKTFQALRIAVNNELKNIEEVLPIAVDLLRAGGKLCVISFHSLEDRLVKNAFRLLAKRCVCPPEIPKCICDNKPELKIITKKPILPAKGEMAENPRARSAKLRVAEKL